MSLEAYLKIMPLAPSIEEGIFTLIGVTSPDGGLTCDDIEKETGLRHQTVCPRLWSLSGREEGKPVRIKQTKERRETRSRRFANPWVVA